MNRFMQWFAILLCVLMLTACGSEKKSTALSKAGQTPIVEDASQAAQIAGAGSPQQFVGVDGMQGGAGGAQAGDSQELLNNVVFYFEFDKSNLTNDYMAKLHQHADYLNAHPSAVVRIEGHTDERGSREYNIALGERRAQAVERALLLDGVNKNQVVTVSYGQEKPAVFGHDESAWHFNRRAVIFYEAG